MSPNPLDTFKNSAPATGHFGATRQEVENGLIDRLAHPSKINQGPSSLCGAAAIMYAEAKYRPDEYTQYVIDLYKSGHTNLGNKTSFTKLLSSGMQKNRSLQAAIGELAANKVVFLIHKSQLFEPYFPDPSGQYPHQHQPYTNRSRHPDHWGVLLKI